MSENTPSPKEETSSPGVESPAGAEQDAQPEEIQLPDDHSLVKTLAAQKEQIKKLKERANRLDEIEQEQMSEAEKAEARVKAAEERAAQLEATNARKDVAIEYELSADDAKLLNGVTDIEAVQRIAERLSKQAEEQAAPRTPKPHPAQQAGDPPAESKDSVARAFFGI